MSNSKNVTRLGDVCTGHGCFPPRPNAQGSPNVFVNFLATHRRTDYWIAHCCGGCHSSNLAKGSPTVFANFLDVSRVGDPVMCGSAVAQGSPNVYAGDYSSISSGGDVVVTLAYPALIENFTDYKNIQPSTLFSKPDSPPVTGQQAYPQDKLDGVLGNPDQYYKPENAQSGAKPNFAGTPVNATDNVVDNEPPVQCKGNGVNVLPFLQKCLAEAKEGKWRETGQAGNPSNPNILGMWKNLGLSFSSDQIPWCAGFACFAMKQSGMKFIKEPGASKLTNRAKEYEGKEIPINEMKPGDLVLWGTGHVNFCYTSGGGKYTFVGGNQSPTPGVGPPIRDPKNDGDVTISWPSGWAPSKGGITKVVRIDC